MTKIQRLTNALEELSDIVGRLAKKCEKIEEDDPLLEVTAFTQSVVSYMGESRGKTIGWLAEEAEALVLTGKELEKKYV